MKQHFYAILACLLLISVHQKIHAQQIDSMMAVYAERFPTEKMHIQFDKNLYNKEETIWYKIYILSGTELSQLSKNVYVEWYDTSGKMIKQTVAPLYQATAKGSFDIPANYSGNFIHVKAFTRWMLNDDPAFLFDRELAINTSTLPAKTPAKPIVYKTRVETFPESGFLIQGLTSRVAFKATNQFGNPVFIKGVLTDNKNLVLDSLRVKHDGMGSFILTPEPSESYQLKWTDENGKTGVTDIPVTKKEGAKLAIRTTNDKALVQIQRTTNAPDNFKHMNLLVHMNQNLLYKVSLNSSEKEVLNAQIPIDNLPTGIVQFSLFTSDWVPVAERIIFVNNHMHEFNAKLTPALVNLDKRGKNVFEIYVTDTAVTNMSIAVTDASVSTPYNYSIFSDMLLSSEIKGKIYNPAYYLTSDADSVTANLDLVMLTNGWRRFDWEKIEAGQLPTLKYPRETDLMQVSGKVFGMNSVSSRGPLLLNVIIAGKDSSKHFAFIPVEKDGSFKQPGLYFYDTAKVYYSFNGNDKLTDITQVQFDNGLLKQTLKTIQYGNTDHASPLSDSLAKAKMDYLLNEQELLKKNMASATLQEVVVKARSKSKEEILDERYASGLFSGGDAQTFDLTDNPASYGSLDIISYLQGRVAGLIITGSGGNMTMSWRGATPDLFVNESPSDMNMVQSISVSDIAMVKVFRPPFFGSIGGGSGGAIAIYTKKGNDATKGNPNSKGLENTVLGGYSRFKEFFNPNYEKATDTYEQDMRSTLYWNPYVITNKRSPRYKVEFYNNDITKKFLVVLEGVNSDGKMTRTVKLIE
ncbi:MAG: hypothetical protein KGO92_02725 [Bacteroidota bacterium]|nr:hypothetical protein [Bacteroidota bacterium]